MGGCVGKPRRRGVQERRLSKGGRTRGGGESPDVGGRRSDDQETLQQRQPVEDMTRGRGVEEVDSASAVEPVLAKRPPHAQRASHRPTASRRPPIPIHYVPANKWDRCAYCDNPTGDRYDYFHCHDMPPELLEELSEHGWWRTGKIVFKPRMKEVCCPAYAIRVPVVEFLLSKSHRRVLRRWRHFLINGHPRWEGREGENDGRLNGNVQQEDCGVGEKEEVDFAVAGRPESVRLLQAQAAEGPGGVVEDESQGLQSNVKAGSSSPLGRTKASTVQRSGKSVTPGRGADPNRPPCRKAKVVRAERRQHRLAARGVTHTATEPAPRRPLSLLEILRDEANIRGKHRLEVKLLPCNPPDPQLLATLPEAYRIYDKFQTVVHPGKSRFESLSEFKWGFLSTPLRNPTNQVLGTYHMHYYLDGVLTMISILDILPRYLVSIYFIYDPDIRYMMPGIYTCLREMELILKLREGRPELRYYALGYYNHFSSKIAYKRQFGPQEILCNETDMFVPLLPNLTLKPYSRLAKGCPEKEGRTASIDNMVVYTSRGSTVFRHLTSLQKDLLRPALSNLIAEAGSSATHQFAVEVSGVL